MLSPSMLQQIPAASIPSPAGIASFYDQLAALGYQDRQVGTPRFQAAVELTKSVVDRYELETGLEVGCAEGLMTREIAPLFTRLEAVDCSPALIARCPTLPNVRFVSQPTQRMKLADYDLIVAFEVLEHLRRPAAFVRQCLSHCKYFIASCPINEQPNANAFAIDRYGQETAWGDATGHIWAMNEEGFRSLVAPPPYVLVEFGTRYPCGFAVVRGGLPHGD